MPGVLKNASFFGWGASGFKFSGCPTPQNQEVSSGRSIYCARSSCVNFIEHLLRPSALLDLVNIVQVELDLRNATGAQNLLLKFTQPNRAQYSSLGSVLRTGTLAELLVRNSFLD